MSQVIFTSSGGAMHGTFLNVSNLPRIKGLPYALLYLEPNPAAGFTILSLVREFAVTLARERHELPRNFGPDLIRGPVGVLHATYEDAANVHLLNAA